MFQIFQSGPIFFILGPRKARFLQFLQAEKRPTFLILRLIKFVAALKIHIVSCNKMLRTVLGGMAKSDWEIDEKADYQTNKFKGPKED